MYRTTYEPLPVSLPPEIHLLSLSVRDENSDDLIARLEHIGMKNVINSWKANLFDLFDTNLFFPNELRQVSLTANTMLEMGFSPDRIVFPLSNDRLGESGGLSNWMDNLFTGGGGDRQNTNEDGVFISQAALDRLKKPTRRVLLGNNNLANTNKLMIGVDVTQINSYIFKLTSNDVLNFAHGPNTTPDPKPNTQNQGGTKNGPLIQSGEESDSEENSRAATTGTASTSTDITEVVVKTPRIRYAERVRRREREGTGRRE